MLSDDERRELARIEESLTAEDHRLADAFRTGRRTGRQRRRWPVRALIGFGIMLLVVGLLTGTEELFLQGLLFGGAGVAWSRWRAWRGSAGPSAGAAGQPSPRPGGGSPPEWFRPV